MKDDTRQPLEATSLKKRLAIFELIFDNIYNGVKVTDADGYITHFNKPYGRFLGLEPEAQIGKHCIEVVENTRMHIVAKTGKAEINQAHWIKGQNMVVQRIPIKMDGKVIAVFGQVMFKDIKDVRKLAQKLSLLEDKKFEQIGGNTVIRSDFRLIAATNQNLDKMIAGERFRKDLFYRLNVISIHIPPLRERKRDIIPIARHLLHNLAEEATLPQIKLAKETEALLKTYDWPGNVREISNVLELALSALDGETINRTTYPSISPAGGNVS